MLRVTSISLRVSAYSIFLKDLSRQGKLRGEKKVYRTASAMYRKLGEKEKEALRRRAAQVSYPALEAYNRFQKEYAHRFAHLPNKQRQRKVAGLWKELKEKGTVKVPKETAPRKKGQPAAAQKKIRQVAKTRSALKRL